MTYWYEPPTAKPIGKIGWQYEIQGISPNSSLHTIIPMVARAARKRQPKTDIIVHIDAYRDDMDPEKATILVVFDEPYEKES
jgi:hypothetical protein